MATPILRVAVLGDSAMWGQGLARETTYARVAAARIAERLGRQVSIVQYSARSGAKIHAEPDEAESFLETFPSLASTAEDVPQAAGRLYGDIPQTFPTVEQQLDRLIERRTPIDLLFINGGANDLDFEEVLDPTGPANFIEALDPEIEDKVYARMLALLRRVRDEFPHSTVIVPGYFAAVSEQSDKEELQDLFEHMSGRSGLLLVLNAALNFFGVPGTQDLDRLVDKAVAQAVFGHGRGLYWLHRAVAEVNAEGATATPLLFCHSAFEPHNALFASEPFVHDDYKPDTVHDPLARRRRRQCPRIEQWAEMAALESQLVGAPADPPSINGPLPRHTVRLLNDLVAQLDGPTGLVRALHELQDQIETPRGRADLLGGILAARSELSDDIGRIERTLIASFLHPNTAGAAHYADAIVTRWDARRADISLADTVAPLLDTEGSQPDVRSVGTAFRRYGIDPAVGLRALSEHLIVDSVAVEVTTRDDSSDLMFDEIVADLGADRWRLHHFPTERAGGLIHFAPGTQELFTFDTVGGLPLGEIERFELTRAEGIAEDRGAWRPAQVNLHLNGVEVFRSGPLNEALRRDQTLAFAYPG